MRIDLKTEPSVHTNDPNLVTVYRRVEGNLIDLPDLRAIFFFALNAKTLPERLGRLALLIAIRSPLYALNKPFRLRCACMILRGMSLDRLDALGDEYFRLKILPQLKQAAAQEIAVLIKSGAKVVLTSTDNLAHVIRPLAQYLKVNWFVASNLEFSDGVATGRLISPELRVLRRGSAADADSNKRHINDMISEIIPTSRPTNTRERPVIHFGTTLPLAPLSVRNSLAGKRIMLVGVTGFIGKVWLTKLLLDIPDIGHIYLLIRRKKGISAFTRLELLVKESPIFEPLVKRFGDDLPQFLRERITAVEGDITQSGLMFDHKVSELLRRELDIVINSSGLVDFNPDLRDALATNVDAAVHMVEFVRQCKKAGLLHLSTCYVAGSRDGHMNECIDENYTPKKTANFNAEQEWHSLHARVRAAEKQAANIYSSNYIPGKPSARDSNKAGAANSERRQVSKHRMRWMRDYLTDAGTKRAIELGWPNTYTFSKSLAESLIYKYGRNLPISIVRPAIVETSIQTPFPGWNEGINTSAPITYLMATKFRQLPSNRKKMLDIVPVDEVCKGITLIAAALIERRHAPVYQLASSVTNPCNMGRTIELTSLAHRKNQLSNGLRGYWRRLHLDTVSISKRRYQLFSVPGQKALLRLVAAITWPLPRRCKPFAHTEHTLARIDKLVRLFEPFILYNEYDFVAENIEKLSHSLVSEEKESFGYAVRAIDWWDYWINIHIPGLRRWSYPLIERRRVNAPISATSHVNSANPASSGIA